MVPTSGAIVHSLPSGLMGYAWPDMASQNRRMKLCRYINQLSTQLFASNCEAVTDFAELLSPWGKLWIVALLVGALHMYSKFRTE